MSWTEEKVAKLKELWGKGSTASQIAEIIGGISRNAVIGKAHRLNLSAKIKTRAATSNQSFENSIIDKDNRTKRGRRSKFKSLIIEKNFFTLLLSYCPGGIYEVAVIAIFFDLDPEFVSFHHIIRLLMILFIVPIMLKIISKKA